MPGFDGTGPVGSGPMTGRGAGYCAGFARSGYRRDPGFGSGLAFRPGFGRGLAFRRGAGYGRGAGRMFAGPVNWVTPQANGISEKEEINYLNDTASALENELNAVRERLNELQNEKK